jgi:hypothetical protein
MAIDLIPRTERDWMLHVWELEGAPETWPKQLEGFYKAQPVFAVLSGASDSTWNPVQSFCQSKRLPCLFPSIKMPPQDPSFYTLYFSKGVALEGDVIAQQFRTMGEKAPKKLVQFYAGDDIGMKAAQHMSDVLSGSSVQVETHQLAEGGLSQQDQALLDGLKDEDALALWVGPDALGKISSKNRKIRAKLNYLSGYYLNGHYEGVPESWRPNAKVIYPFELGAKRRPNQKTLDNWLQMWNFPSNDIEFASEVFFNLLLITDITTQMLDNLHADYLIERTEDMLSAGQSNVTGYPHLSLAPGQRFASKGAYVAKFDAKGDLVPETDWIVP